MTFYHLMKINATKTSGDEGQLTPLKNRLFVPSNLVHMSLFSLPGNRSTSTLVRL